MPFNRRELIKAATTAAVSSSMVSRSFADTLELAFAGYPYEHVKPLAAGDVGIEGAKLSYSPDKVGNMNSHLFVGPRERAFSEVGLGPYLIAFANNDFREYSLIPVFPLRTYRHKSIFIHADAGIDQPSDLRGRRIGTPGYSMTSLTWIRGMLNDQYGVSHEDVEWVLSAEDSSAGLAGTSSAQEQFVPEGLNVSYGPAGKDESDMLVDRDVDALFHAIEPRAFVEGHPKIKRLFPDSRQAEREYYAETGIFPIMHAVAIRKDLVDAHPWLPEAVFGAYAESKSQAYSDMKNNWALRTLPWFAQEWESTVSLMGENFFPYGLEVNRRTLEAFFRYMHEQQLTNRRVSLDEVFVPSTTSLVDS